MNGSKCIAKTETEDEGLQNPVGGNPQLEQNHTKKEDIELKCVGSQNHVEGTPPSDQNRMKDIQPKYQRCYNPWTTLFFLCSLAFTQSMTTGYINSVLTTLEIQFKFKSVESGLIKGTYDIACMIIVVVLSYVGDQYNRARLLGIGAVFIGVGALLFSLPNIIQPYHWAGYSGTEDFNSNISEVYCNGPAYTPDCPDTTLIKSNKFVLAIFMFAQVVIGVGASAIFTLGTTYLYDNVKHETYPIYAGIFFSMAALGPAVGYLMGAGFLSLYVQVSSKPPGLTKNSHNWVGAWWIGFLVCGICALIVSVPLILSPKQLSSKYRSTADDADIENCPSVMTFSGFSDFKKKTGILLKNKVWIFVSLAMVMEQAVMSAVGAFILKYAQLVFHISASSASFMGGGIGIPSAVVGMILGGFIMKRTQLSILNTGKLIFVLSVCSIVTTFFLMFLVCESIPFAGLTTSHKSDEVTYSSDKFAKVQAKSPDDLQYRSLISDCNVDCQCSIWDYDPVCGTDRITYFSPCFAGCTMDPSQDSNNYTQCSCINETISGNQGHLANKGKCDIEGCPNFVTFLVLMFITIFLTSCAQNPIIMIIMRCVEPGHRSYAFGLQNLMARILAFIPTPIYFGQIFDSQCLISSKTCDKTGDCLVYNTNTLPFVFFGTFLGLKLLALCFVVLTCCFAFHGSKNSMNFSQLVPDESESQVTTVSVISVQNK